MRTWKIIEWIEKPEHCDEIELQCPNCGHDAMAPIQASIKPRVIAAIGLKLIFDPPGFTPPKPFMPNEIQCRHCLSIFTDKPEESTPCTASSSALPSPAL